jgi:hypothetical protein
VETGMVSSEYLKSGTGEYLTSRRRKVQLRSKAEFYCFLSGVRADQLLTVLAEGQP